MTVAMIPGPWEAFLLAAAVYRTWRLLAEDELLDGWRAHATAGRPAADRFIHCPWCLGTWIAAAWFAVWLVTPDATVMAAYFAGLTLAAPIGSQLLDD